MPNSSKSTTPSTLSHFVVLECGDNLYQVVTDEAGDPIVYTTRPEADQLALRCRAGRVVPVPHYA